MVFRLDDVNVYKSLKIISEPIMQEKRLESIYVMNAQIAYIDKTRKNETNDLWHVRLEHVDYQKLKMMIKKLMLKRLSQLEV